MKPDPSLTRRFPLLPVVLWLVLFPATWSPARTIDSNHNGMSDIWELIYDAQSLDPNSDADSDGVSNLLESIAGTDPSNPASVPQITVTTVSNAIFNVTMPCTLGKQYSLQSIEPSGLSGWSNWVTETSLIARSGSTITMTSPVSDLAKFFRIAIADVDSDGDGVNDWEEYQLGLDPNNPFSNGQTDPNGQALGDLAFAIGRLAKQNVVTISAVDPTANQPDFGQAVINQGQFAITRGGFPLNALTVNIAPVGSGPGTAIETLDFQQVARSIHVNPGTSAVTVDLVPMPNTNRMTPAVATLQVLPGPGYQVGSPGSASVVVYPSATPSGTGLSGQYFTNSSATYSSSANFNPLNLATNQLDGTIDFTWGTTSTPIPNNGNYSVRWTGQVQPQYSETYFFVVNSDDGVKLWVNDQLIINRWVLQGATDSTGAIALQGGVRYNIRLEYFNGGGGAVVHLSWYSASQPKQIIPGNRLYPASVPAAPTSITSPLFAYAFLGQAFSFAVTGANSASYYTATGLPPGLNFDSNSGIISGVPNISGDYQVLLTASNAVGVSGSMVDVQVIDTGSAVVREVWSGVPGVNISDIPLTSAATITNAIATLEGTTDFGDNYGERVRGYFTAPVSGNYYFWIAGSDSAELWISNDSEPANKVRRAYVAGATAPRQWNLQASQRSGWLSLVAGQRYYLEVLHKSGVGPGDNWSVGWLQDPTGTNNAVSEVVPGFVLSKFYPPPVVIQPGALYTANMLAQANALSTAVGTATLRVSADGARAILKFTYSGLTSPLTGEHIHADQYLNSPSQIIFDIDEATPQPDGTYVWNIAPVGTLSAADIVEIIREGKAYINIHTVNYPGGEINGHFTLADGVQNFITPPPAPLWTDNSSDPSASARFLIQATFGPSPDDIAAVQSLGYEAWLNYQFALPPTHHLPFVLANRSNDPTTSYPTALTTWAWWQQSVTAPDQLRQRVAFALSEIMVVSGDAILQNNARALSAYYDILLDNAFGNFRELIEAVTLSPAMGLFLDMRANDKGSIVTGIHANENYAREIMQLFSIGLYRMWPDGSLVMDSQGNLVPTYDQNVIMGMASVFTGWNYYQTNQANGRLPTSFSPPANYINPMVLVPTHHDLGTKQLLDHVMLPQAWGSQADSTSADFDTYCSQDLEMALDTLFNNQNVGPFVCRQLIQRLVTSNPSRDYLYRVVQVFNDNGFGVRGDLQAVIGAILLDYEARSIDVASQATFGKQREPLLRVTATARAFPAPAPSNGSYSETGTQAITVTTPDVHRLNTGDIVWLTFTDTSGQAAPNSQGFRITVQSPNSFRVDSPGMAVGTYAQTNNIITVTSAGHGLVAGNPVYLLFTSGGASNALYQVVTNSSTSVFTVATTDSGTLTGNCLIPKLSSGGYTQSRTNITINVNGPHGLNVGDPVYINFTTGTAVDGQYQVATVPNATHFTVITTNSVSQSQNGVVVYPLVPPSVNRSGSVVVSTSTWHLGNTDTALMQTPLGSPTVFNFYFPDYKFPGTLASAGLTTPEFQLTSDSSVASQMNFLEGGLLNNGANTNGITSFVGGNAAVALDTGPWMTLANTSSSSGISSLVDALSTLLIGGQLHPDAKTAIVNYVANTTNFAYGNPPSYTQMRDRVRAVVHLLVTSPEFTVQR